MTATSPAELGSNSSRAQRYLPVLAYHSFAGGRHDRDELATSVGALAEHLARITDAGYRVVGLTEALRVADEPVVALTIDDGYRDLLAAVPVLAEYDATATLYVPAGLLGGHAEWLPGPDARRALLSGEELRDLAGKGFEIGAHGWAHAALDLAGSVALHRETAQAREALINKIGVPVMSFAFPFGYSKPAARRSVAAAGYTNACVLGHALHRRGTDPWAIRRLLITSADTGETVLRRCQREVVTSRTVITTVLRVPWREYRRYTAGRSAR